ncbi:hypothetical protein SOCEGT47_061850 [Sorangium cellulosum]|uniref:Secreted protein n=1 Tax=Sorangium cellulosum TaxID=56 RepID=A0A4P2Q8U1_SORCE|nr:hypothetical protein [Sorangium cellulosum]AUX25636.1 hypothetical protein SOCEGT47_061850 [Sorangium cellulosum]
MIGRRARWGLGGLVMAMAGCGPAPAPQAADGTRAEAAAPGPGASGASGTAGAAGASRTVGTPGAAGGVKADEAPTPAPPTSAFTPMAQIPAEIDLRLHPVEGALLVSTTHPMALEGEPMGSAIGVLKDGKIEFPKRLRLPGWWVAVVGVHGRYPDQLDLIATGTTGRTGVAEHYVLGAQGWVQRESDPGLWFTGVARMGSSLVGLVGPTMLGAPRFITLRGPRVGLTITQAPRKEPCRGWEAPLPQPEPAVRPEAFGATRDGSALSYGTDCSGESVLEVWKPGEKRATLLPVPAPSPSGGQSPGDARTLILPGPGEGEAWIVDGGVLRYHGGEPRPIDPPAKGAHVLTASAAPDGTLWAIADGALFARKGEAWEPAPLPDGVKAQDVAVGSDGAVWVAAGGAILKRGGAGEAAGAAPGPIQLQQGPPPKPRATRPFPRPGGPECPQNLVVLYTFSKTAPDDYDFPMTRKALKGRTEFSPARFVVTRDMGQRFLAAFVPSWELAKRLQERIKADVHGSTPQIVCAEPEVVRELKLDLKTGEVAK